MKSEKFLLTKKSLVWLTNVRKSSCQAQIDDLCRGYTNRHIIIGEPATTSHTSIEELKAEDIVGLYEDADSNASMSMRRFR